MKTNINILTKKSWLGEGSKPLVLAGPCSAETASQVVNTAKEIAKHFPNAIYRAGIWKPRTRPDQFEGVGERGLAWLNAVQQETGLSVATEVANARHVEACLEAGIDYLWVGARTTVNPFSVQEIADASRGVNIPVLVKNPINPDLALWMGALERLNKAGITRLAAIHRGFGTGEDSVLRNIPRWELPIQLMTACPDLPVICDPSHICGNREMIPYVAQKAMDLDMDGLMIETHIQPDLAWSDAKQQITPAELKRTLAHLSVRLQSSGDLMVKDALQNLREQIDGIDEKMLMLFSKRMKLAVEIGQVKKQNDVTVLQTSRWKEIEQRLSQQASLLDLNPEWIMDVFALIHQESIRKQQLILEETKEKEAISLNV